MEIEDEEKPEINLHQHQRHKKSLPWQFVMKVVMGITLLVLLYYFAQSLLFNPPENTDSESEDDIEVLIENE